MGKSGSKSKRNCRSTQLSDPGESKEGTTVIHSTSQGNGGIFVYGIYTASPELVGMYCWTINTASSALILRADEYPCIQWTTL